MITTLDIAMLTFMKKLTKEQIEKRKRIKEYFLKSLNIVSYILSALFIIVCVAVSVQSCNTKNKNNSQVRLHHPLSEVANTSLNDFKYYYVSRLAGMSQVSFSRDQLSPIFNYFEVPIQLNPTGDAVLYKTIYYDDLYCYYNDEIIKIPFITHTFAIRDWNPDIVVFAYVLQNVYAGGVDTYFVNKTTNYSGGQQVYDVSSDIYFMSSDVAVTDTPFLYWFNSSSEVNQKIVFPNRLNYYFWINDFSYSKTIDSNIAQSIDVAKSNQFVDTQVSIYVYIDMPYFTSNGKLYNRIALNYLCLGYGDSARYFQNRNTESGYDSFLNSELSNFGLFLGMGFMNTNVDSSIADIDVALLRNVIYLPTYPYSTGSLVQVYTKEFTWQLPAYQKIQLLTEFPNESSLTSFELLISQSINNASVNVYSSLFTLLGYAFASLKSIFDIQVMPMLSIGVLIFTPLLIGLIVIIFRMVKK